MRCLLAAVNNPPGSNSKKYCVASHEYVLSLKVKMWKEATVRAVQTFFLFKLSFQVEAGRETIQPARQTIHQLTKQRVVNHRLQFNKAS